MWSIKWFCFLDVIAKSSGWASPRECDVKTEVASYFLEVFASTTQKRLTCMDYYPQRRCYGWKEINILTARKI